MAARLFHELALRAWDEQFYPEGSAIGCETRRRREGWDSDRSQVLLRDERISPAQIRLEGGDASSDSYCFP